MASETAMLIGPDEIARRIQYRHQPGWVAWYGHKTKCYWAVAAWVPGLDGMLSASQPEALDAAIAGFEMLYPKPGNHAVGHRRDR
jgi:hypothetical protein